MPLQNELLLRRICLKLEGNNNAGRGLIFSFSGKILRRILRKLASGDVGVRDSEEVIKGKLGDLSTLAEPGIISEILKTLN